MSWLLPPLPPTFEAALRDVRAHKAEARIAAAERLARPPDDRRDDAARGLRALTRDRDARVRAAAVHGLKELGDAGALPELLPLLDDGEPIVRELTVIALGELGGENACEPLRNALRSPHPEVRFQAVLSYVEACAEPQLSALGPLLRDEDPKVRANAVRSLAVFGDDARAALRRALEDDEAEVRAGAALGLARRGEAPPPDALRLAFDDAELLPEALDAVVALELRSLREEVAAIARSVLRPLPHKVAAARALIRLGDARGVPALRAVLRAFRSDARSFAVQVVGDLGLAELTPELLRLSRWLRGTDPETLVSALSALLPTAPAARRGLQRLARRRDAAGELARKALAEAQAGGPAATG